MYIVIILHTLYMMHTYALFNVSLTVQTN